MIRKFIDGDINDVMDIWLDSNIFAHSFISEDYWRKNFEFVKQALPKAQVYVYEENGEICGFIGMSDDYVEGIFVRTDKRGAGIGTKLLETAKEIKNEIFLGVYCKNKSAVNFYKNQGFVIVDENTDNDTSEAEYTMGWKR